MPQIFVINKSGKPIDVFVSKYSGGGSDDWFTLNSEAGDTWKRDRNGWELVAFRDNNARAGVYVELGGTVEFHGLKNIKDVRG